MRLIWWVAVAWVSCSARFLSAFELRVPRALMRSTSACRVKPWQKLSYFNVPISSTILRMADVRAEFNWKATKKTIEEKMQKCIEHLQSQFNTIRAGGANPMILDRLMVNNMGTPKPLNQLARISKQNAYQLLVEPFDVAKIKEIEKAITTSDLGVTPNSDGYVIRINIPPLTEERRKDLVKQAKAKAEDGKVSLRNVRRDFVEKVKQTEKDKHIGKDESKNYQEDIQKVMETFVKKVDELLNVKEKDLSKL